ncbi:hypothetical protein LZ554_002441 [Drepanopeziza brunnea f. sp. 'monogermtubi']|nr:hypothetical protein LZ554_002441 [Drepanopeziza brunnea f. sp. 'monogermtubi']
MAITALPQATIHLLGSAQALTTPTSLVKELIDNALDAKATYIDILISPNTIDKIEVRDNGHGIPEEDFDALGRRGHTSKLRSFDELKSIGGVTLGFRGEALASAVQLGQVSVTTRTDGHPVATMVQLKAPGGVASQSRASHPVGTTVSVSKFLYKLPVRKQTAEKEAAKTLKKLKDLLYSYALARPKVRLSLKVSKGGKGSWSFTPRPNDGMREAAAQIIGREAAAQCIKRSLAFSEQSCPDDSSKHSDVPGAGAGQNSSLSDFSGQFFVEIFVPKPDAISAGHGQYMSVDSRPVAHDKGTMRKIVSTFKYYVKNSPLGGDEKLKDPFLWLNIKCPVSSYDPNVEPAKDDILFGNEYLVLGSIEQLFKEVYGEPVTNTSPAANPNSVAEKLDNFELLMSRKTTVTSSVSAVAGDAEPTGLSNVIKLVTGTGSFTEAGSDELRGTGEDYSDDIQDFRGPSSQFRNSAPNHHTNPAVASVDEPLNPWIIAKLNAPVPPRGDSNLPASTSSSSDSPGFMQNHLPTPQQSSDPINVVSDLLDPTSPARPRQASHADHLGAPAPNFATPLSHQSRRQSDGQLSVSIINRSSLIADSDDALLLGDDSEVFRRRNDFNSARSLLNGSMPTFSANSGSKRARGINKPFVPPMRTSEGTSPHDSLQQMKLTMPIDQNPAQDASHQGGRLQDLAWTMDYEYRKEDASRKRRMEVRAARVEAKADANKRRRTEDEDSPMQTNDLRISAKQSPHKNRYGAAISNLEMNQQEPASSVIPKQPFKTSIPDGDPRAYLMKRQKSMQSSAKRPGEISRPMRARSTRLPLERIPDDGQVHTLMLKYTIDMGFVQNALLNLSGSDTYVSQGIQSAGLVMNAAEAKLVQKMVQSAVEKWRETEAGKQYDVEYKCDNLTSIN